MNTFLKIINNKYIYVPIILWAVVQTFKVIWELIKTKKFNFKRIMGAGGMPSSHSAIVVVLTTMIGKYEGVDTAIFALSLIFSFVVMYDAAGVRRAAGKQATLLNKIVQTPGLSTLQVQERLVEVLGHTPVQVFVGAIIGIIVGLIV
ncbi:MAG: divergent PAP2 family protein [Clostridia bacterium]|nr:divergent PAP2 family protein [Clostridia bacterium]